MRVSKRWRVALAIAGLIVVLLSLAALAYAVWPIESASERFRPAPTLFAPPQSAVEWPRLT